MNQQRKAAGVGLGFDQLAAAVEHLADAVEITDADGRLQYVNRGFERNTGFSRDEALGRTPAELLRSGAHSEAFYQTLWRTIAAGQTWAGRVISRRKDGRLIHQDTVVSPVYGEHGDITHFVAVKRDVTDRRMEEAEVAVQRRLGSLNRLAAGIAHEFNNPLQGLLASLDALQSAFDGSPHDVKQAVQNARCALERVRTLVRDLGSVSAPVEDDNVMVALSRVVDSSIALVRRRVQERARLLREVESGLVVAGDHSRLVEVFTNLLMNAADSVPVGRAAHHTIAIRAWSEDGSTAVVEISDTGGGIEPQVLENIFDPFFTTKGVSQGVGIGLSLVHGIVSSLGGSVTVRSTVNQGSTFRVCLPTKEVAANFKQREARGANATSLKVLIVDDDRLVGQALARALRSHDVCLVHSGREAIDLLCGERHFDLVLCDLMMPEVTGMEVYDRVAEIRPEVAEGMVFITGAKMAPEARRFLARVDNHCLEKPFSTRELWALLMPA